MTVYVSRTHAAHRAPRRVGRIALRLTLAALAALAATAAATLGPVAWQLHRDRAQVAAGQDALGAELDRQWNVQTALVAGATESTGLIGRMHIPRLGLSWVIVEGVDLWQIETAPGHYPGTARPGQRGNAAFAAHRESGMWADLDAVTPDDAVIIQTRTRWYTYRVVSNRVMPKTALAEVDPVPPGMNPGKLLTLTTCWPRWTTDNPDKRLIVHAVLERTTPADQPPPEVSD